MRECCHCNCSAICLPMGREEFLSRLIVCNLCDFPIYAPRLGDLVNFEPGTWEASPFGPGRKTCNPICWAFHVTFGLEDRGDRGYTTCAGCRKKIEEEKREVVAMESRPVGNNTIDGAAYAWIIKR